MGIMSLHIIYTREDSQRFDVGTYVRRPNGEIWKKVAEGVTLEPVKNIVFFDALRHAFDLGIGLQSNADVVLQYTSQKIILTVSNWPSFHISRLNADMVTIKDKDTEKPASLKATVAVKTLVYLSLVFDPWIQANLEEFRKLEHGFPLTFLPSEIRRMFGVQPTNAIALTSAA